MEEDRTQWSEFGEEERVPMGELRKVLTHLMVESRNVSPTVQIIMPVDMTEAKRVKAELAAKGTKATVTALLVKTVAHVLADFPLLNCSVDGDHFILKKYVNIGVVVAVEGGIMVPVIRNADKKGIAAISAELKALAEGCRAGTIRPEAQAGGTFTISNVGTHAVESFTCILKQPEVAILGVPMIVDTVVAVDGTPAVRPILKLCLTFDHRAFDGTLAAQFLTALKNRLEDPSAVLL